MQSEMVAQPEDLEDARSQMLQDRLAECIALARQWASARPDSRPMKQVVALLWEAAEQLEFDRPSRRRR